MLELALSRMVDGGLPRNLGLDLLPVSETAAMAASDWIGKRNKEAADQAAVDAMRRALGRLDIDGVVRIGEGEKDEAPMLYIGEAVGTGQGPAVDIAVDPLEGTTLTALGLPNAISVLAAAEGGSVYSPPGIVYVDKLAVGPGAVGAIDINTSPAENLRSVAAAYECHIKDLTVVVLDRPRHAELIDQICAAGAGVKLIRDGDVLGAIEAFMKPRYLLMGVGGTTEAVLAAAAARCLGGEILVRLWPRDDQDRQIALKAGLPEAHFDRVFASRDLVSSNDVHFVASGVTTGDLLDGIGESNGETTTCSVVMSAGSGPMLVRASYCPGGRVRRVRTPLFKD